jgi:hypothetical protein
MEIRRISIAGRSRQKVSKTPVSTNKLNVVVYACDPSYAGVISRNIVIHSQPEDNMRYI